MGWLSRLFTGEDAETRNARKRMADDLRDPRRAFVWGVLAVSYEVDPAYLTEHATEACRDWYGVTSGPAMVSRIAGGFAQGSPAYDQYRKCFLARAGFGAGLLDEAQSWGLAMQHAAVVQQHYRSWMEYGQGYLEGHLAYRSSEGDTHQQLAQYRKSINERLALEQRAVWSGIPFATPM